LSEARTRASSSTKSTRFFTLVSMPFFDVMMGSLGG
jgi:hypothetical protein